MRRFEVGVVVATPAALEACLAAEVAPSELLERHASGDWGDVPPEDTRENEYALNRCLRLLSSYPVSGGAKVGIITEADRSSTCILLPEEY